MVIRLRTREGARRRDSRIADCERRREPGVGLADYERGREHGVGLAAKLTANAEGSPE